jgi:hypothetical protein
VPQRNVPIPLGDASIRTDCWVPAQRNAGGFNQIPFDHDQFPHFGEMAWGRDDEDAASPIRALDVRARPVLEHGGRDERKTNDELRTRSDATALGRARLLRAAR